MLTARYSCLNGWTCGNIAASVGDISNWFFDLFHGVQVKPATLLEMMNGIPLSQGWSPGLSYGLGTMQVSLGSAVDSKNLTWTIGHGGCDYGSIALVSGYNDRFNFSISIASNVVSPMSVSGGSKAFRVLACLLAMLLTLLSPNSSIQISIDFMFTCSGTCFVSTSMIVGTAQKSTRYGLSRKCAFPVVGVPHRYVHDALTIFVVLQAHAQTTAVGQMYSQAFYYQAVCWIYDGVIQVGASVVPPVVPVNCGNCGGKLNDGYAVQIVNVFSNVY